MTRAEAIGTMNFLKHYAETHTEVKDALEEKDRIWFIEAIDMAISDMTAISMIRAKLNTEYNNTSGDVQAGIAIALGILDRYTKGGKE